MKRLSTVAHWLLWTLWLALLMLIDGAWSAYQQNPALQLWLLGAPWCG